MLKVTSSIREVMRSSSDGEEEDRVDQHRDGPASDTYGFHGARLAAPW
jgi:hypothetical protein